MVPPVKVLAPARVIVPVPCFTSEPLVPEMTPLTVVERLLPPTVSALAPSTMAPAPSTEPIVTPVELRPEMSSVPEVPM